MRKNSHERNTKETQISASIDFDRSGDISLDLPLPFFSHMLNAFAFHGGFNLSVTGKGDIDIDPHHLVEDTGLVIGELLNSIRESEKSIGRYGHSVIPMDDSLAEVTVDAAGRPFFVFKADFPQPYSGNFDISLVKEFMQSLAARGKITLHCECRYGENSHHMAEALFKALGKAVHQAFAPGKGSVPSTKGTINQ